MSDEIQIGDDMIKSQLCENSKKLCISLDLLIDQYIRRGLFSDDYYYLRDDLSREELEEICKKDIEIDKKHGILPKKHNFNVFVK